MRTNKQLKGVRDEFDNMRIKLAELGKDTLDYHGVIAGIEDIKNSYRVILDKLYAVDKVWANDDLIIQVYNRMILFRDSYNKILANIRERFDRESDEGKNIAGAVQSTHESYITPTYNNVLTLKNYSDDPKGRTIERFVRVGSKILPLALVTTLAGGMISSYIENQDLKGELGSVKAEYSIVGEQLEDVKGERDDWKGKYEVLLENSDTVSKEDYEKLRKEYEELQGSYKAIMVLIPEGSTVVEYIAQLKADIDTLETTIDGYEIAMSALNDQIDSLNKQLDAALKDGTNEELIKTLRSQLAIAESNFKTLEATHNATIIAHNKKVGEFEATIDDLVWQLDDSHKENEALEEENKALEEENKGLKAELKGLKTVLEGVKAELEGIKAELDEANKENAELEGTIADLDRIIAELGKENVDLSKVQSYLIKLIAEIKGVSYESLQNLSIDDLLNEAKAVFGGMPSGPAEQPGEGVHENSGSGADSGSGAGSAGADKPENGDGTGNISPDLPPVRE